MLQALKQLILNDRKRNVSSNSNCITWSTNLFVWIIPIFQLHPCLSQAHRQASLKMHMHSPLSWAKKSIPTILLIQINWWNRPETSNTQIHYPTYASISLSSLHSDSVPYVYQMERALHQQQKQPIHQPIHPQPEN